MSRRAGRGASGAAPSSTDRVRDAQGALGNPEHERDRGERDDDAECAKCRAGGSVDRVTRRHERGDGSRDEQRDHHRDEWMLVGPSRCLGAHGRIVALREPPRDRW